MNSKTKDILIVETNFKVIGEPSSDKTRFKGVITPESIFGGSTHAANKSYFDYTSRDSAKEELQSQQVIDHIIESDSNYFGYTSRQIDGSNFTFTSNGFLKTEEEIQAFKETNKQLIQEKGSVIYEVIIAFKDLETAYKNKLYTQNDYAVKTHLLMQQITKIMKMDYDNVVYWQDYHNKKDNGDVHPHIHINFFEKIKTRENGKDKITKTELKMIKREAVKTFVIDNHLALSKKKEQLQKDINQNKKEIKQIIQTFDYKTVKSIHELLLILPDTGRLQYNSIHMKPYRNQIDRVVDQLLQHDSFRKPIQEFSQTLDRYDSLFFDNINSKITNTKTIEMNKLKQMVANEILQLKKQHVENIKQSSLSKGKSNTLNKQPKELIQASHQPIKKLVQAHCSTRISEINREIDLFLQSLEKQEHLQL